MSERRGFRADAVTRLLRDVEDWETTILVHSTARFSEQGEFFCYGERITYQAKTADAFLECQRGASRGVGGSEPRFLPGGSEVRQSNAGDYTVHLNGLPVSARPGLDIRATSGVTVEDSPDSDLTILTLTGLVPPGVIVPYAGTVAPDNWYLANGDLKNRIDDASLFAVIGTTYGVGDGSTTFGLPNLQARFPYGAEGGDSLGATGGATTHLLTASQSGLPQHNHSELYPLRSGSVLAGNGSRNDINAATTTTGWAGPSNAAAAHNNMPPYIILNYLIKR